MRSIPIPLLDPAFVPTDPGHEPMLRYAIRLHAEDPTHFDFSLEIYGRLLTFAVTTLDHWRSPALAMRLADRNSAQLLTERESLVWDHGLYRSDRGTQEDVYRQLKKGNLLIHVQGVRFCGRFQIAGSGEVWRIAQVDGDASPIDRRSALSGLPGKAAERPYLLWLEWKHYYADPSPEPQVVVDRGIVLDLNFAAKSRGIAVGMRLQHVLPLVPGCQVKELALDPDRQRAWLDMLVPFTDVIQPVEHHSAVVDLSAHPTPADIVARIVKRLSESPFGHLQYGVGPDIWIAQLASQQGTPFRYDANVASHLAPQPVENLLALDPLDRDKLSDLGIQTIGAISTIGAVTLRTQFGESAHALLHAAQGKSRHSVAPLYPPKAVSQTIHFEAPVDDSLTLQNAANDLARQLANRIPGRQAGLVILIAEREDGSEKALSRPYKRPVHEVNQIAASIRYLAEQIQKECPGIIRLTARLDRLEPIKSTQKNLFIAIDRNSPEVALAALKQSIGGTSVILASQVEIPRREQVLKAWRNATGWN